MTAARPRTGGGVGNALAIGGAALVAGLVVLLAASRDGDVGSARHECHGKTEAGIAANRRDAAAGLNGILRRGDPIGPEEVARGIEVVDDHDQPPERAGPSGISGRSTSSTIRPPMRWKP